MMDWDNLRVFLELTRSQGLVDAAKKLGIDHSTVSRRIKRFEEQVGSQLFDRNHHGYSLTAEGYRLVEYAEKIESTVYAAAEELGGHNRLLSGQVRLGATEGFGTFVLAPHIAHFCARNPHISVDMLPMPRFVNLSKREADISVTIERPVSGNYVVTKLADYALSCMQLALIWNAMRLFAQRPTWSCIPSSVTSMIWCSAKSYVTRTILHRKLSAPFAAPA